MRLFIFALIVCSRSFCTAMWCVDGTDCDPNCGICEGAACLRIQGQHPSRGQSVAMTCLPHDSLIHLTHPEGCRTDLSTHKKTCLCSQYDFCNSAGLCSKFLFVLVLCALIY